VAFLSLTTVADIFLFLAEKAENILPAYSYTIIVYLKASRGILAAVVPSIISYLIVIVFIIIFEIYKYKVVDRQEKDIVNICINSYLFNSIIVQVFSSELMGEFSRLAGIFVAGFPLVASLSFGFYKKRYSSIVYVALVLFLIYRYYKMRLVFPEALFPYKSIFG
jgi:hypothetical protein